MSGKLLSLFAHPEFVRRSQARAERELAEQVVPVIDLGRGRYRCRRCSLDFDAVMQLSVGPMTQAPCPECDVSPDFDTIEAFLEELLTEK
jgi:hypothetical protein